MITDRYIELYPDNERAKRFSRGNTCVSNTGREGE